MEKRPLSVAAGALPVTSMRRSLSTRHVATETTEHLHGLALFFEPRYRARYLGLVERGRLDRIAKDLPHFKHLDDRFAKKMPDGRQGPAQIAATLREHGAPSRCFVLSDHPELHSTEVDLDDALTRIVGFGYGTLISCLPGRLAYFEGEEMRERYLLERPPA